MGLIREWALPLGLLLRHGRWLGAGLLAGALAGFVAGYRSVPASATVLLERVDPSPAFSAGADEISRRYELFAAEALRELQGDISRSGGLARAPEESPSPAVAEPRPSERTTTVPRRATVQVTSVPGTALIQLRVPSAVSRQAPERANVCSVRALAAFERWEQERLDALRRETERRLGALDRELERVSRDLLELHRSTPGLPIDQDPNESLKITRDLETQIRALEGELAEIDAQLDQSRLDLRSLAPPLVTARENLARARTRFTEEHPKVKELQAVLAGVEAELQARGGPDPAEVAGWGNSAATSLLHEVATLRQRRSARAQQLEALRVQSAEWGRAVGTLPEKHVEYLQRKSQYAALRDERFRMANQRSMLAASERSACLRILRPATGADPSQRLGAALGWAWSGGLAGGSLAALGILGLHASRRRIRGADDLARCLPIPVVGTLEDVERMNADDRLLWGLHALTALRSRIGLSPEETLVCGVASLGAGEGRSTVIRLLAEAARRLGFEVVTLSAGSRGGSVAGAGAVLPAAAHVDAADIGRGACVGSAASMPTADPDSSELVGKRGDGAGPESLAVVAGPAGTRGALQRWAGLERTVVLVELPPVTQPEAFILADRLPHLLWVSRINMAGKTETRAHWEGLGRLRANWVGAVLNRAVPARRRWQWGLGLGACLWGLALAASGAEAQETNSTTRTVVPAPVYAGETNRLSVLSPDQLAGWQKRLTLGPGDVFNIHLYEQPDTLRNGLFIGPDGRLSYLEAQDVVAAGLTVDELRARLEAVLAKYRLSPRVVVNPVTYASKKYYLLGNVNQKGVFNLDRPVTVIEAIARAGGFVTAVQQRNVMTQADLSRSFLMRRGPDGVFARVPVDFEGLFQRGELSQNLPLAPEDYLFFPALDLQEVYVLGEVLNPGIQLYTKDLTTLGAIVGRGGYTARAYKGKVLVVRGSLNHPQTFVINTADIVAARAPDFALSNRDIVYVNRRPFAKAEELLEAAVVTFARAFVTEWTGRNIEVIKEPLVN